MTVHMSKGTHDLTLLFVCHSSLETKVHAKKQAETNKLKRDRKGGDVPPGK